MKKIRLLDCTLRDGGYLLNAEFGDEIIKGIIAKLAIARIDVIECGFLKDEPHVANTTIFSDVDEVIPYLPSTRKELTSSFVLLADCSRYKAKNLKPFDGRSIDGIRECFQKNEVDEAFEIATIMKNSGYKVYLQPVDILGYSDFELLQLIEKANKLMPYAFSVVDTFGSMYIEDLTRLYSLINHNLNKDISIGFHSHNNMQMSFALSQKFVEMAFNKRSITVDATVCGMGRGAGNTNTELVANFLNEKYLSDYGINELLDLIDLYMPGIKSKCEWGYSTPYFLAGMYSSHVHNITYLLDKHSAKTKDMRAIIESLDSEKRKKYDYDYLENLYISYFDHKLGDNLGIVRFAEAIKEKSILLLMPGNSLEKQCSEINKYLKQAEPFKISINYNDEIFNSDIIFVSNVRRYERLMETKQDKMLLLTSNVKTDLSCNEIAVQYGTLIKKGWKYFDNASVLMLRLLARLGVTEIAIAGFDGFGATQNYAECARNLVRIKSKEEMELTNREIIEMLIDFKNEYPNVQVKFITKSRFQDIFE